jgi:hypothetical protein
MTGYASRAVPTVLLIHGRILARARRVSRRCAALKAAAAALEEGAAALAAAGAREDAFYGQLARLQRYWLVRGGAKKMLCRGLGLLMVLCSRHLPQEQQQQRVQQKFRCRSEGLISINPTRGPPSPPPPQLRMPPADSPYSFLVSLGLGPDGAATPTSARATAAPPSSSATATAAAVARTEEEEAAEGAGVVPLLKDATGRVRVQVAAPRRRDEVPSVMVKRRQGARYVA